MSSYQSNRVDGITYFFTVRLEDGVDDFLIDNIKYLQKALRSVLRERPFYVDAMVVLPDHIHCLWTFPVIRSDFLVRWQSIEKRFIELLFLSHSPVAASIKSLNQKIWQHPVMLDEIIGERDYRTHMDYIHFNPVKHGLVDVVDHWSYSTFHRLSERGIYLREWGEDVALGIEEVV